MTILDRKLAERDAAIAKLRAELDAVKREVDELRRRLPPTAAIGRNL